MRHTFTAVATGLGLFLFTGCENSPSPTDQEQASILGDSVATATLSGMVVDSDSIPVRARVLLYFVGPVPPDTVPPDTVPPDSTPPDSTPPDSNPPPPPPPDSLLGEVMQLVWLSGDSLPGDSIPGDSTPPPPASCAERGDLVGRTRADGNGLFRFEGLAPGVYDLRASAEGETGTLCGRILRAGESVFVTVMTLPRD